MVPDASTGRTVNASVNAPIPRGVSGILERVFFLVFSPFSLAQIYQKEVYICNINENEVYVA